MANMLFLTFNEDLLVKDLFFIIFMQFRIQVR